MDQQDLKLNCSICKSPFSCLPQFETVPKDMTIAGLVLDNPLCILMVIHYCTVLAANPDNLGIMHAYISQVILQLLYFTTFAMNVKVNNWGEYITESGIIYMSIAASHGTALYMMMTGCPFLTLPIAASTSMYWHAHKTTLKAINTKLLYRTGHTDDMNNSW